MATIVDQSLDDIIAEQGGQGGRGGGQGGRGGGQGGGQGGRGGGQGGRGGGDGKGKRGGKSGKPGKGKKGKRVFPPLAAIHAAHGDRRLAALQPLLPEGVTAEQALPMLNDLCLSSLLPDDNRDLVRALRDRSPTRDEKDLYLPPLTVVFAPAARCRLWLGGQRAADDATVLEKHGIKAKICAAGLGDGFRREIIFLKANMFVEWFCFTLPCLWSGSSVPAGLVWVFRLFCFSMVGFAFRHGYAVKRIPGIQELDRLVANHVFRANQQPAELAEMVRRIKDLCGHLLLYQDLLIYCVQGANRSAAIATAVIVCMTGCSADEVIIARLSNNAECKTDFGVSEQISGFLTN